MNKRITILLCALISFSSFVYAQNNNVPPSWIEDLNYEGKLENSYLERIIVTTEVTRNAMFEKAKEQLAANRLLTTGERVVFSDGETQSQSGLTIYAKKIDEYITNKDGFDVGYFLFQIKNRPDLEYEKILPNTTKYGFSGRVFVPGMAQIYKGQKGKGVGFIIGEVVMVGGIVTFEGLRVSYQSKIKATTHNPKARQNYINDASTMKNLRNGFIAGAAALYIWNIIDGCVAKGKPHISVKYADLQIAPYISPDVNGLTLNINF